MTDCFAFAIGGMPNPLLHPLEARRVADFLKTLDGLIGLHVCDRYHTLLAFGTLNNAIVARNRIQAEGNPVAKHIMRAEISDDKQRITILGTAD